MSKSKNALKALMIFMGLMAALTLVSRAADSLTICRVTSAKAKSGALMHTAKGEGRVLAVRETYIWCAEGLPVGEVCAAAGDTVERGDVLARFDENGVRDALGKARTALAKLESQNVKTAETDTAAALLEKTRAAADAQKAFDEAKKVKTRKAAQKVLDRAQEDLALAQKERTERIERENKELGALALEIDAQRKAVSVLSALLADGCALRAAAGGVVTAMNLEAGKASGGEAAACVADLSGGLRLTLKVSGEETKFIEAGDEALVTRPGERKARKERVGAVSPIDADGNALVTVSLTQGDYAVGGGAEIQISHKTDRYEQCVDSGALRGDSSGDYVLVLRERRGVLGDETVTERVAVTVLDRDDTRAALDGALRDERIVVEADKPLSEGDRVRPTEP